MSKTASEQRNWHLRLERCVGSDPQTTPITWRNRPVPNGSWTPRPSKTGGGWILLMLIHCKQCRNFVTDPHQFIDQSERLSSCMTNGTEWIVNIVDERQTSCQVRSGQCHLSRVGRFGSTLLSAGVGYSRSPSALFRAAHIRNLNFFHVSVLKYAARRCFCARKQLLLSARLNHCNSGRPSVCLSHGWISQKRCKLGLPNLHRRLPGRL